MSGDQLSRLKQPEKESERLRRALAVVTRVYDAGGTRDGLPSLRLAAAWFHPIDTGKARKVSGRAAELPRDRDTIPEA